MSRVPPSPSNRAGTYGTVPVVHMDDPSCRNNPTTWAPPNKTTPTRPEMVRLRYAQRVCMGCPALVACRRYLAGWSHPDGVVAGRVFHEGVEVLNVVAA